METGTPSRLEHRLSDETLNRGPDSLWSLKIPWHSSQENNLKLNTSKTKELVIDFRRQRGDHAPLLINGVGMEKVASFKGPDLVYHTTAAIKKAQQRLHFLRVLRRNHLEKKLQVSFYRATIEPVLLYCTTVWFTACRQESTAEGHQVSRKEHRLSSSHPGEHYQLPWHQQSHYNNKGLLTPRTSSVQSVAIREETQVPQKQNKQTEE
ncbi:hypothetical protein N1851_014241 [Merluccius polli]|uniref:Alkylated DNA repair protein AlkB homologue 8 N-terminal domain-containing protein n=1 Tax=Merluccius polli TaxID=89951 RepID=A0AA47P3L3_MERPO|nr:hypothetical protein N1851_014241 [Merluccius polli]